MSSKLVGLAATFCLLTLFAGGCPAPLPDPGTGGDPNGGAPGGDNTPFLVPGGQTKTLTAVELPGASAREGLIGWSSVGSAPLTEAGVDLPVFDSGPQLGAVFDADGAVLLLGWVAADGSQPALSVRSTAEVLAYFDVGGWLLPGNLRMDLLAQLQDEPGVAALAAEIERLLDAPGATLTSIAPDLNEARDAFVAAALTDKDGTSGVRVEPGNAQSGIRINQPGLNTIVLTNTYRRRALAYVERLTPSREQVREIKLSPTVGATSVAGILSDLAQGNIAYAPVSSDPIGLELVPETAEETEYRVTVVGMGGRLGALEQLTIAQTEGWGDTVGQTIMLDFFIPLLANTLIPINGNRISAALDVPNADALVSTYITSLTQAAPAVMTRARNGELVGALGELGNAFATDGTVRLLTFDLVLAFFRNFTDTAGRAAFIEQAEAINQIIGRFDAALTAIDSATQVVQIGASSMAETWDITVNRSRVQLTPVQADILFGEQATFTASVPDATGDDAPAITWNWRIDGDLGTLRDAFGRTGNDFDSSRDTVTFTAGRTEGQATLTVEAFEVVGSERRSLGTATAPITVRALRPTIVPRRVSLGNGDVEVFRVEVPGELGDPNETYSYIWRTSGQYGGFRTGVADNEVPEDTQPWQCRSGEEGSDTVSCEVLVTRDGAQISLGEASAEVLVEQGRRSIIMGSFEIRQFDGGGGTSCCQAGWIIPKVAGAKRYDILGYNFNDPFFYGKDNRDFIVEGSPRMRDGGGAATPQIDEGGNYYQGLSGGCSYTDVAATCAWLESRFAGILVEVTVTYEE